MDVNTVYSIMRECRNFFETGYLKTDFTVAGGVLSPSALFPAGSLIAIEDSAFYTGVYQIGEGGVLTGVSADSFNDSFRGRIWFLRPPAGFVQLCNDIADFIEKMPKGAYQSESFGEYSYTRAGGKNGGVLTWQEYFAPQLSEYRRMCTEVRV